MRLGNLAFPGICILLSVWMCALCISSYQVGVKSGDWFKYGISDFHWESTDPNATMPPEMEGGGPVDSFRLEVIEVSGTNVTVKMTMHFKNGTEQVTETGGDVASSTLGKLAFFLSPAGLSKGEALPAGATVNETVGRTYAGAKRDVNLVLTSFSMGGSSISYKMYFDKATGIMCELVSKTILSEGKYVTTYSSTLKLIETNMWERAASRSWMWLFGIVAICAILLVAWFARSFLRKGQRAMP